MISHTCTSCGAVMTIDDAFAGGVCRCQQCGTIQTVPRESGGHPAHARPSKSVPLYQNGPAGAEPAGSAKLNALAHAVSGSGPHAAPAAVTESKPRVPKKILLVAGGVLLGALLAVVIMLADGRHTRPPTGNVASIPAPAPAPVVAPPPPVTPVPSPPARPAPPAIAEAPKPQFMGVSLARETCVIYVLDRGNITSADNRFDNMRQACYRSLQSLGPGRTFQVIFWNNDPNKGETAIPPSGPVAATAVNIAAYREAADDLYAYGQSDVHTALRRALDARPSAIVLATAKDADAAFGREVLDLRGTSTVRMDCFSLAGAGDTAGLRAIAEKTGGQYRDVSMQDLESFGQ